MGDMLRHAWTGLRLRCPACGTGATARSLLRMHEECPVCRAAFEREEGDFLGAVVVAYSVTAVLVAAGVYLVEVVTNLSTTAHILLWSAVAAAFLLLTYRNMRGIWLGILHAMVGLKPRE